MDVAADAAEATEEDELHVVVVVVDGGGVDDGDNVSSHCSLHLIRTSKVASFKTRQVQLFFQSTTNMIGINKKLCYSSFGWTELVSSLQLHPKSTSLMHPLILTIGRS